MTLEEITFKEAKKLVSEGKAFDYVKKQLYVYNQEVYVINRSRKTYFTYKHELRTDLLA